MFEPDQIQELKRRIFEATQSDSGLLEEVLADVTTIGKVHTIQPRSTSSISLVASDGGNNRIEFNPFSLQIVRVVDTLGETLFLDVVSPTTDTVALGERHLRAGTPLGRLMHDLEVGSLPDLSPMIPAVPKTTSWPLVFRDLCEWAVLYELLCHQRWGSSTLVVRDGLLRSKIFTGDLFIKMYRRIKASIETTKRERKRDLYLVGIAKHSEVIARYRLAMSIQDVLPAGHPWYAAVPESLQRKVYNWAEYVRSPEDDAGDVEKPKFNMGAMHIVRFGDRVGDPVWTVDLMHFQAAEAQRILASLLGDAQLGFPVPYYPHCLQEADRHAQVVDLDLALLQDTLEQAVREQIRADRRPLFDAHRLATVDPAARRYG